MSKPFLLFAAALIAPAIPALAMQTPIKIDLVNTGGAAIGTNAYLGFRTAANYWQSVLTTSAPTTITLNVGFQSLGTGILGQTGSTFTSAPIASVERQIRLVGSTTLDAAIRLPTLGAGIDGPHSAVSMYTPGYTDPAARTGIDNATRIYDTDGSNNNSVIGLTSANAKALGYVFTDPHQVDGGITFSSDLNFDFDPTNGIGPSQYDFLGVAVHEIGHALGFMSGVDDYDRLGTGGQFADSACFTDGTLCRNYPANDGALGKTLDLFRYSAPQRLDWTPGTNSYFSIDGGATAFKDARFSTGSFNGDGNQASHWIDNLYAPSISPGCVNAVTPAIGIMNPTVGTCEMAAVTALDLALFDAIGFNTGIDVFGSYSVTTAQIAAASVPDPAAWATMLGGFGVIGFAMRRRRADRASA